MIQLGSCICIHMYLMPEYFLPIAYSFTCSKINKHLRSSKFTILCMMTSPILSDLQVHLL